LLSLDGDVTVRDRAAHVDVDFSELLENLDFGGQIHLRHEKVSGDY
jgi:hypothetical protein